MNNPSDSNNQLVNRAQQLADAACRQLYDNDRASRDLGMRLEATAPGSARLSMEVRESMLNGHRICHGGFIFALADSAFAFACNSHNEATVASGADISFIAPARLGETLTASAQEVSLAGRSGVYDVLVCNGEGAQVALFRGRSRRIRGAVIAEPEGSPDGK